MTTIGHITVDPFSLPPIVAASVNEILLCTYCDATWRVLNLGPLGTMRLVQSLDPERNANAEISHCPSCQRKDIGVRFFRPVPTRQLMRAAIKELCDRVENPRSPSDGDARRSDLAAIDAYRKEFNVL